MNSMVKASDAAATIPAACWTDTPAFTRLLPKASPTTPTGHAVQTCKKKKANGGAPFLTVRNHSRKYNALSGFCAAGFIGAFVP